MTKFAEFRSAPALDSVEKRAFGAEYFAGPNIGEETLGSVDTRIFQIATSFSPT
jgi:hypothetical protein